MKLTIRIVKFSLVSVLFFTVVTLSIGAEEQQFEYLQEFEGLHITGVPFDFDMHTYRFTVTGKVDHPLSLTFEEMKALPAVRKNLTLTCPGYFTDSGTWTGVPVRVLLEKAGVQKDAKIVIFSVPDDSYRTRFPVAEAMHEDMLIAYEFNGKQFHRVHGFPLRLVAGGKEGSDWVKWLQKIVVE
ncbi:MAG TPA: molybdopterin-dependent oxidoreductase [Spirochaetales bacterium]|nr:molybdopterin-dependent oxidoreductase [Spirochaetales bacterium]HOV37926.1 molybdopterin-dependent oxidoreductase [Spirochaetales bacterium]